MSLIGNCSGISSFFEPNFPMRILADANLYDANLYEANLSQRSH